LQRISATASASASRARHAGIHGGGGGDILYYASRYLTNALGSQRYAAPDIVERNIAKGRIGPKTGAGSLNDESLDIDAYRRERLRAFVSLLSSMGLTKPPVVCDCLTYSRRGDKQMNSASALLPSLDRIRRTIEVETAYTISRMQVIERISDNAAGIAVRQIDDGLVALMARGIPIPFFNSVIGLRAGHEHHIAPLVAWYRDNGVKARFELVPGNYQAELGRELTQLGYYPFGFHLSLIARPEGSGQLQPDVTVEHLTGPECLDEFFEVYVAGWGFRQGNFERFKANVCAWLDLSGWSLYLGRINGRPAAAGTLYVNGEVGYLADAATDPTFRRRGLHTALLRRRIQDAGASGCAFVCSGADFLSASHRNMERIGMRIQFIRTYWTPL
jgi:ribosomal protein S18 acetylase RimI-like enzyme